MQTIRNFLQLSEDLVTVCVTFMTDLTLALKVANIEKLARENLNFITKGDYCIIKIKAFSEFGADETLICKKLSSCLTMVNTNIRI